MEKHMNKYQNIVGGLKKGLNKAANAIGGIARKAVGFVDRNARNVAVGAVTAGALALGGVAHAQTDATVIATNAQTAFGVIAPITITIAGFYVILSIAKRVVR
jgi:hypothetical protein